MFLNEQQFFSLKWPEWIGLGMNLRLVSIKKHLKIGFLIMPLIEDPNFSVQKCKIADIDGMRLDLCL